MAHLKRVKPLPIPGAELARLKETLHPHYGSTLHESPATQESILVVRVPREDPDMVNDVEQAVEYLDPADLQRATSTLFLGDTRTLEFPTQPLRDLMADRLRSDRRHCQTLRAQLQPGEHRLFKAPDDPRRLVRLAVRVEAVKVAQVVDEELNSWAARLAPRIESPELKEARVVYLIAGKDEVRMDADQFFQDLSARWSDEAERRRLAAEIVRKEGGPRRQDGVPSTRTHSVTHSEGDLGIHPRARSGPAAGFTASSLAGAARRAAGALADSFTRTAGRSARTEAPSSQEPERPSFVAMAPLKPRGRAGHWESEAFAKDPRREEMYAQIDAVIGKGRRSWRDSFLPRDGASRAARSFSGDAAGGAPDAGFGVGADRAAAPSAGQGPAFTPLASTPQVEPFAPRDSFAAAARHSAAPVPAGGSVAAVAAMDAMVAVEARSAVAAVAAAADVGAVRGPASDDVTKPHLEALQGALEASGYEVLRSPPGGHGIGLAAERDAFPNRLIAFFPPRLDVAAADHALAVAKALQADLAFIVCGDADAEAKKRLIATRARWMEPNAIPELQL